MPSFVSTLPIPSSTKHETKRFLIPIYIILAPAFRLHPPPPSGIKPQRSPSRSNLFRRHPPRLRHLPCRQCKEAIHLPLYQHGHGARSGGRCSSVLPLPVGGVHARSHPAGSVWAGHAGVRQQEVGTRLLRQVRPGAVQRAARLHAAGEGKDGVVLLFRSRPVTVFLALHRYRVSDGTLSC